VKNILGWYRNPLAKGNYPRELIKGIITLIFKSKDREKTT
jgi:hypothetical protein